MKSLNYTLFIVTFALNVSSIANGLQSQEGVNADRETIDVTEGENLTVTCNVTGKNITWHTPNGQVFGRQLNLINITRKFSGLYDCVNLNDNEMRQELNITIFYLDVSYPSKITFVKVFKPILQPRDTYELTFGVEGNPAPSTTFISLSDGKTWYNATTIDGNYTIRITNVNCTDVGDYELTCENGLGVDSKEERIDATCVPDPVTDLYVTGITNNEAVINFVTGNDNSYKQFFYVMRISNGKLIDFHMNITDTKNDTGGEPFYLTVKNLSPTTTYNFTIIPGNRWGNSSLLSDFVSFYTEGKPEPDPDISVNKTYKPRLGDSISLIIHARGKPKPSYKWFHNGKLLNSTNENYTSIVDLPDIVVDNFGSYKLTMTNTYGEYLIDFELLSDGPPEPVSNLSVSNINTTCARINFVTGYNYNSTQTFIISVNENGLFNETVNCKDVTSGRGGDPNTCEICSLSEDALYSVTVVANNSRGESQHNPEAVKFSTDGKPKPDPHHPINTIFKPRLGNSVTLSIQVVANPTPTFMWLHNGTQINSKDTNTNSSVDLTDIKVGDFGKYLLNVSNKEGYFTTTYEILADGPPAPVTNLSISSVTVSSANISFTTGYDYNKTQTFIVMRYLNGKSTELVSVNDTHGDKGQQRFTINATKLTMNTEYNVTVLAKNSNGTSPPTKNFQSFMTEGIPEPDPALPENKTRTPRLGKDTSFHVHAIGNPPPNFTWWHNNVAIKHTDKGLDTTIEIHNITEDDFGDYILNMNNKLGNKNYTFTIQADGPPDPVTNLTYSDVSDNSIELRWKAGFDYGRTQTFHVQGSVNNKPLQNMKDIHDTTKGKGGQEQYKLDNLASSSTYVIYLVATNARGSASKSNEVAFSTKDAPSKGDGTTTAEIVGYVVGGIGGLVFIIAIAYVFFRYNKRPSEPQYQNLNEEQEERPQTHVYRYDDAASSFS